MHFRLVRFFPIASRPDLSSKEPHHPMANTRLIFDYVEVEVENHCNIVRHAVAEAYPSCPLCGGDGWELPVQGETMDRAPRCRRCGGVGHLRRNGRAFTPEQLERIGRRHDIRRLRAEGCHPRYRSSE
jgi:hypothetical protein